MTVAKIVYASATGNTEGISEILEAAFEELDIDVERIEADDADEDTYEDADICVLATYTDGDGERPFDLEDFMKNCLNRIYQEKSTELSVVAIVNFIQIISVTLPLILMKRSERRVLLKALT